MSNYIPHGRRKIILHEIIVAGQIEPTLLAGVQVRIYDGKPGHQLVSDQVHMHP